MKILRLSLNNLASLAGTHEINFEQTPLAQAGLIAITGKTGAGKSTLLDAMCLALYDGIPRLPDSDNPRSRRDNTIVDASGQAIAINDPKNILRRGTTSGFAELEFVALDQKRYIARWEIQRARKKVDGNIKVDRSVFCVDESRLMTQKTSECTPFIERITGLTFKQFTRAVLLAQSEVGAFLKAKDQERADLLEYLTNSQIFSEVSKKAAEKYSEVSRKRAELEKYVGNLELLSDEQIEKLNADFTAAKLVLENFTKSEKLLENDLKWHKDRHELYANTQAKKEVYDVQLDADQKLQTQKQLLVYLDQFQPIRDAFNQQQQTQVQLSSVQQQLNSFQPQLDQAQQNFHAQQQRFEQAQQQLKEWQHHREQLKPQLEQARQIDNDIHTQLELYNKTQADKTALVSNDIEPLKVTISQHQHLFNQHQTALGDIEQHLAQTADWTVFDDVLPSTLYSLEQYQKAYIHLQQHYPMALQFSESELIAQQHHLQTQITTWQNSFKDINTLEQELQQQQKQQEIFTQNLHHLQNLQQQAERWQQDSILLNNLQQSYLNNQQQQQELNQQINQQHMIVLQAEQHLQQVKDIFEQQRLLQHQSVQDLRAQLQPDAPCMVCGSHSHPFIEHEHLLETALNDLQNRQLDEAEQKTKLEQQQLNDTNIQLSKINTTLAQQQQRIDELTAQTTSQLQQMNHLIQSHNLSITLDAATDVLRENIQQHLNDVSQQYQTIKQQREEHENVLTAWRSHQGQSEQLTIALQQRQQLAQVIAPVISQLPPELQQDWKTSTYEKCQRALIDLQTRQKGLSERSGLQAQLQEEQQHLKSYEERLSFLEQRHQQLEHTSQEILNTGKQLREQLNEITQTYAGQQYRKFNDWQQALENQESSLHQQINIQRQNLEQTQQKLHDLRLKQQNLQSQILQYEQSLKQNEGAIFKWKQQNPHFTETLIEQCSQHSHEQVQQMRADLERHYHALSSAKSAWETLEEQYNKHLTQKPELEFAEVESQLAQLITDKQAQQDIANAIDTNIRMNENKKLTLIKYQAEIEQVKAEEYRWGRIYDLIGHRDGVKFQKIAQEHHLDILVEYANQQLQPLAPRYQLHRIPDSLSLAILDLDMNNEIRPVLSLSGGETFLVSLALALAIANMASGSMKLESLFIDEGFGTLDPSSLHMVMNALDSLQSQGRKVVLISHIQEMHERIPVQIQVQPVGNGTSRIEVVG